MISIYPLLLLAIIQNVRCHCPHMMGMKPKEEDPNVPKPPGILPEGDKGWDYDEANAPGAVPEQHYIQSSFIHRSRTESEHSYAKKTAGTLREVQERLKRETRLTIENENIDCSSDNGQPHYRCADFPTHGSYHFLVVEDSKTGAAVYSLDKKYNEKSEGAIEAALLDALSRHSPYPLTSHASKTAEKVVGFVRKLSSAELSAMSRPPSAEVVEKFSPLELKLMEPTLLLLRHGEDLEKAENKLKSFTSKSEFDAALETHEKLVVLFWSNVHAQSLHVFNIFARTSNSVPSDVVLGHVECHKYAEFCAGLKGDDFNTVVAYRSGVNIGTTAHPGEVSYLETWLKLIYAGPLIELKSEEDLNRARRGELLDSLFPAVTIGTFQDDSGTAFKHFAIAAEKLAGRYVLAYYLKEGASSVTTYRRNERRRRHDYEGRFDPASLVAFISSSSMPSVIDISSGFTTDALFRQRRAICTVIASDSEDTQSYYKLAAREDVRKNVIFTLIDSSKSEGAKDVMDRLFISEDEREVPHIVLFRKEQVFLQRFEPSKSAEELLEWIEGTEKEEPQLDLSPKDVHPLRMLQVAHVNDVFGHQETLVLPDHTLFNEAAPAHLPRELRAGGGGCPFMAGGGATHDEL